MCGNSILGTPARTKNSNGVNSWPNQHLNSNEKRHEQPPLGTKQTEHTGKGCVYVFLPKSYKFVTY